MTNFEITLLYTALRYAADGFSVYPIWTKGVEWLGIDPKGTRDPATIYEYWTGAFKGCQIGIRTGRASNIWLLNSKSHPAVDSTMDVFKEYMEDRLGPIRIGPFWRNELGYNFVLNTLPDDQCPTIVAVFDRIQLIGDGGFVIPPRLVDPNHPDLEWEHGEWFGISEFKRSCFLDVPSYVRNSKNHTCDHMPNRVINLHF